MSYTRNNFESDSESENEFIRKHSEASDILCDAGGDRGSSARNRQPKNIVAGNESFCFSTRTALIVTGLVILITAVFVIILDLVILEVERSAAGSNHLSNLSNSRRFVHNGPVKPFMYSLNGSEDSDTMEVFESVPNKWAMTHFYLNNVEVAPAVLQKQLEYADRLKVLSLINVTFFGRMGSTFDEIYLPSLEEYIIDINQPIGPKELLRLKNRNCTVTNLHSAITFTNFQHKDCLRSLIFFKKYGMVGDTKETWSIEQIHMLNTTIKITLFGFHLFMIDPEENELTSVVNYSEDILLHIINEKSKTHGSVSELPTPTFQLKKLNLRACPVKTTTLIKFAEELTSLHLGSVNFTDISTTGDELSTFIRKFKNLNRFYFMGFGHFPKELQIIDLNDITNNVKELRFGLVDIDYKNLTSTSSMANTKKFNLDHFYLHHIGIKNIEILNKFHEIFANVTRIYWDGKNYGKITFSRLQFWLNIMKIPNIQFILFDDSKGFYFPGRSTINPASLQLQTTELNNTVKSLLDNINVNNIDLNRPFILRRDNTTTNNGQWIGKNFDVNNDKDLFTLYMESGNVDEKFLKFDSFIKLRFPDFDKLYEEF